MIIEYLRRYYRCDAGTTEDQLRQDFGEFPPLPLDNQAPGGKFLVVRSRGIGTAYQDFKVYKNLYSLMESSPEQLSLDLINMLGGTDYICDMQRSLSKLNRISPALKEVCIWTSVSMVVIRKILRRLKLGPDRSADLGAFVPMLHDESRIYISPKAHENKKIDDESTISHEHIHLLQYRARRGNPKCSENLEVYLETKDILNVYLKYLLERDEVEARLHECVLSFYRENKVLPTTLSGFFGLLSSSKEFGDDYALRLQVMDVQWDRYRVYKERERSYAIQLTKMISYGKSLELECRFITEVLVVMYGNLLYCYGDENTGSLFLENVRRPNLYDELYPAK